MTITRAIPTDCTVPHFNPCHTVLGTGTLIAVLDAHGFEHRVEDDVLEVWEPAYGFDFATGETFDASAWIIVPTNVHDFAAWLGY